jgi:hypothetical protein
MATFGSKMNPSTANPRSYRSLIAELCLATIAGAFVAWVVMFLALYEMYVAGGFRGLWEPPLWALGTIGASGAAFAILLVLAFGRRPLPGWVEAVSKGALKGAGTAMIIIFIVAGMVGGMWSKGAAGFQLAALLFGLPTAVIVGAWIELKKRSTSG